MARSFLNSEPRLLGSIFCNTEKNEWLDSLFDQITSRRWWKAFSILDLEGWEILLPR